MQNKRGFPKVECFENVATAVKPIFRMYIRKEQPILLWNCQTKFILWQFCQKLAVIPICKPRCFSIKKVNFYIGIYYQKNSHIPFYIKFIFCSQMQYKRNSQWRIQYLIMYMVLVTKMKYG